METENTKKKLNLNNNNSGFDTNLINLISEIIDYKQSFIVRFYNKKELPLSLQNEYTKNLIFENNNKLMSIEKTRGFARPKIKDEQYFCGKEYIIEVIMRFTGVEQFNQYFKFSISNEDVNSFLNYNKIGFETSNPIKIELPDFKELIEYIILLINYTDLLLNYNNEEEKIIIENQNTLPIPTPEPKSKPTPHQLQTNLTDTQRGKLFDLLVLHGFIPETDKEGFIWALGGEQTQPSNWQPIEWIDKSITRKEPNIQTLFELLYLLGVDKDTSANNPNNLYRKMEFCFNGFVNIAAKNPCSIQQKTDRQRLLKSILEDVEKVRAQK